MEMDKEGPEIRLQVHNKVEEVKGIGLKQVELEHQVEMDKEVQEIGHKPQGDNQVQAMEDNQVYQLQVIMDNQVNQARVIMDKQVNQEQVIGDNQVNQVQVTGAKWDLVILPFLHSPSNLDILPFLHRPSNLDILPFLHSPSNLDNLPFLHSPNNNILVDSL